MLHLTFLWNVHVKLFSNPSALIYSYLIKTPHLVSFRDFFFSRSANSIAHSVFQFNAINMQVISVWLMPSGYSLDVLVIIFLWQHWCSGQEAQSAPWWTSKHLAQWNSTFLCPAMHHRLIKVNHSCNTWVSQNRAFCVCVSVCVRACVCLYVLSTLAHQLCCCAALQPTGLVCWCWRCLRFRRSAACKWRGASTTNPATATANQSREHVCWSYSAGRPSSIWNLHPKTSSIFTPHGKTPLPHTLHLPRLLSQYSSVGGTP